MKSSVGISASSVAVLVLAAVVATLSHRPSAFVSSPRPRNSQGDVSGVQTGVQTDSDGELTFSRYLFDAKYQWHRWPMLNLPSLSASSTAMFYRPPDDKDDSISSASPLKKVWASASSMFKLISGEATMCETSRMSKNGLAQHIGSMGAVGQVVRTAARQFRKDGSSAGSESYTTRKDAKLGGIFVEEGGVVGDYNDYRTKALSGTRDRAVSILTGDVMTWLRTEIARAQDGDLGENVLVSGVVFGFFEVGQRYRFYQSAKGEGEDQSNGGVVLEITEPAVPCANLCNLPYINDFNLERPERVKKCQKLIQQLGGAEGLRGWYAKVIAGGSIRPGDSVALV